MLLLWRPALVAAAPLLALACLGAALACLRAALAPPNTRRIDISGLGELRLTVQGYQGPAAGPDGPLALLPGSTLWPQLLLLRLQGADGGATALAVLPDSVAAGAYRPLAVALRHVAGHNKNFIQIKQSD